MKTQIQALLLAIVILGSIALTQTHFASFASNPQNAASTQPSSGVATFVDSVQKPQASSDTSHDAWTQFPLRRWDVPDPQIDAEAVLVESLDNNFPIYRFNTYTSWPLASLTKILTTVTVLEDIGTDKKIPISADAVATEGAAGNLQSGEIYNSEDLLKIMLIVSSNDAAAAFEEYAGGKESFVNTLMKKANSIGMARTVVHDASGLDDNNTTTASDLLLLLRYALEHHPDLFTWTRLSNILIQPLNTTRINNLDNIDPLVNENNFLGGKTGTSPAARQNLVALFTFHNQRVAVIILGSHDRIQAVHDVLKWADEAYQWNNP